jgi:hypothetical protein
MRPSAKQSWLKSLERFLKGGTTIDRCGEVDFSGAVTGFAWAGWPTLSE